MDGFSSSIYRKWTKSMPCIYYHKFSSSACTVGTLKEFIASHDFWERLIKYDTWNQTKRNKMINSNWNRWNYFVMVHCAQLCLSKHNCVRCVCLQQLYHWHVIIWKLFSECLLYHVWRFERECWRWRKKQAKKKHETTILISTCFLSSVCTLHCTVFTRVHALCIMMCSACTLCVCAHKHTQEYECILFWQHKNYLKMPLMLFLTRIVSLFTRFMLFIFSALLLLCTLCVLHSKVYK